MNVGLLSLLLPLCAAAAPELVGVVSDVAGDVRWSPARAAKLDMLDELHAGDAIEVGAKGSVTLLYYAECRKEVITGANKIKVGKEASVASAKAKVQAEETPCEPPRAMKEQGASAMPQALVLMGGGNSAAKRLEKGFKAALKKSPKDVGLLLEYANFLTEHDRAGDAAKQYRAALKLRPGNAGIERKLSELKPTAK